MLIVFGLRHVMIKKSRKRSNEGNKIIKEVEYLFYIVRLQYLNLPTLQYRRLQLSFQFICFQFCNESFINWLLVSILHSITSALNTCYLYYISTLNHVNFTLPPSISSPNLVSTSVSGSPGRRFKSHICTELFVFRM